MKRFLKTFVVLIMVFMVLGIIFPATIFVEPGYVYDYMVTDENFYNIKNDIYSAVYNNRTELKEKIIEGDIQPENFTLSLNESKLECIEIIQDELYSNYIYMVYHREIEGKRKGFWNKFRSHQGIILQRHVCETGIFYCDDDSRLADYITALWHWKIEIDLIPIDDNLYLYEINSTDRSNIYYIKWIEPNEY